MAQSALQDNISKQFLAPAYRSTGKSAAEGANEKFQADLIDYNSNTRNTKEKYALMLADVYTREVRAQPILNWKPDTVNAAIRELMPTVEEGKKAADFPD